MFKSFEFKFMKHQCDSFHLATISEMGCTLISLSVLKVFKHICKLIANSIWYSQILNNLNIPWFLLLLFLQLYLVISFCLLGLPWKIVSEEKLWVVKYILYYFFISTVYIEDSDIERQVDEEKRLLDKMFRIKFA